MNPSLGLRVVRGRLLGLAVQRQQLVLAERLGVEPSLGRECERALGPVGEPRGRSSQRRFGVESELPADGNRRQKHVTELLLGARRIGGPRPPPPPPPPPTLPPPGPAPPP